MTYNDFLTELHSRLRFGIKPGLERMHYLLSHLNNPHHSLKFIHLAGTNGKGSTAAMIASILTGAGYKTGLYTSPHPVCYEERFKINGKNITGERIAQLYETIKPFITKMEKETDLGQATEFEIGTLIALLYFAQEKADMVVLETGLGGRLDATNVVTPELSVITHLALDHTERLGKTLESIAYEKAGIIKAGVPLVFQRQEAAAEVIGKKCRELGAEWIDPAVRMPVEEYTTSLEATRIVVKAKGGTMEYATPLIGLHQAGNLQLAVTAIEVLRERGWSIGQEDIARGLAQVRWPGRMQLIRKRPRLILDGAHNLDGVEALVKNLRYIMPGEKVVFAAGFLANRPVREMVRVLEEAAGRFIFTRVPHEAALSPGEAARLTALPCTVIEDPVKAWSEIERLSPAETGVGCGSLYLIGKWLETIS